MGNVLAPAKKSRIGKLKNIVNTLEIQQRKIKLSQQQSNMKTRILTNRLKTEIKRARSNTSHAYKNTSKTQEIAGDISHEKIREKDLSTCLETIRKLQYCIQSIINVHFTQSTLHDISLKIGKTNVKNDDNMKKNTDIQSLIDELMKSQTIHDATNTTMDTLQDAQASFCLEGNSNHGGKDDPAVLLIIQEVEDEISMQDTKNIQDQIKRLDLINQCADSVEETSKI